MKLFGPSWIPKIAGVATILAGVANLIIAAISKGTVTTEDMGIGIVAVTTGVGLLHAKQVGVTNSPTPLAEAQAVETAVVHALPLASAAIPIIESIHEGLSVSPTDLSLLPIKVVVNPNAVVDVLLGDPKK